MMMVRSRTILAAFTAYAILLFFAAPSFPSYDSEAGRSYDIARDRVVELKKSKKRQRYRSYWMDCIRTFEMVEKKYPRSPHAADSCFDRAALYMDMYRVSWRSRDKKDSLKIYGGCRKAYPRHSRAPQAFFRMIEIQAGYNKDRSAAIAVFERLQQEYPDSDWTRRARKYLGLPSRNAQYEQRNPRDNELRTAPGTSNLAVVTGIRYRSGDTFTRIVVEQDRPIKFESNELSNPDRLVFDIKNARSGESLGRDPIVLNDGILRQVRTGQFTPDTVRIVLDLASIKSYAAFPLHDPERLVIDVAGEAGTASIGQVDGGQGGAPAAPSIPGGSSGEKLSLSQQMGLKVRTIAIDAGHGGQDPGAIGKRGLKEKIVTLDIAKRLAKLVKEKLDCNVIMTRDRDVFIELEDRPAIARTKNADLFVSIHVNASRKRRIRGIETYIQGLHASDADAMETAARENAMSTKKLSELKSELDLILRDLAFANKDKESNQLAYAVQTSLVNGMRPVKRTINLGVKRAFFYVLLNTDMPSILAEVGFISNPDEERLLKTASHRQKIAEALFEGIENFVKNRKSAVMGI